MGRMARAWRAMPGDHQTAAAAALGLVVTLFLPWYQITVQTAKSGLSTQKLTAFGDFSWVEAAVLLVASAVLGLLVARAERRAFHLPGGDGSVILAAGAWVTVLLVWRAFDKPSADGVRAVGLQWGFVFAFAAAAALVSAGLRIRAVHRPEPELPTAVTQPQPAPEPARRPGARRWDRETEPMPRAEDR